MCRYSVLGTVGNRNGSGRVGPGRKKWTRVTTLVYPDDIVVIFLENNYTKIRIVSSLPGCKDLCQSDHPETAGGMGMEYWKMAFGEKSRQYLWTEQDKDIVLIVPIKSYIMGFHFVTILMTLSDLKVLQIARISIHSSIWVAEHVSDTRY